MGVSKGQIWSNNNKAFHEELLFTYILGVFSKPPAMGQDPKVLADGEEQIDSSCPRDLPKAFFLKQQTCLFLIPHKFCVNA